MRNDYLTLVDGRKVRMEWNLNALKLWRAKTGKELADLQVSSADPDAILTVAWCAASEGEDADGRELGMTEKELGRLMDMKAIVAFSKIISEQTSTEEQKKSEPRDKGPRIFFRKSS